MKKLSQEQINSMFEVRLARLEVYLQREGHDVTKYDGDENSAIAIANRPPEPSNA